MIPELYKPCQKSEFINISTLFCWFLHAFFGAIVVSCGTYFTFHDGFMFGQTGKPMDYWTIGYVILTLLMGLNMGTIALSVHHFSIVTILFLFVSYALFLVVTTIWSIVPLSLSSYFGFLHLLANPLFYMLALVVSFVAVLPYFLLSCLSQQANTSPAPTVIGMISLYDPIEYVRQQEAQHLSLFKRNELSTHFYELVRVNLQHPYQEPFELGATEKTALLAAQNTPDLYKTGQQSSQDMMIEVS